MRTDVIALCFVVLTTGLASTAAAQREPLMVLRVEATPPVAPHLADETMELRAPDAGEYVLPVMGVVLGGAALVTGVVGLLGSAFVLALHDDGSPTNAGVWLGGSAALAAVGAVGLGVSIAGLRSLHHRARAAESAETGVQVIQFAPTAGGALVGVAGTF